MKWETVIGLEIHAQLATNSKIFSGATNQFGAEPNTQACAVDLALPGTLPVFNEAALKMAVKFGLAVDAQINTHSVFDRKNYFYPDLPKGYQISQMDHPIVGQGQLSITLSDGSEKTITITRAHLEEDAGKSIHTRFMDSTAIDLNRAGTPLLEIVSEPEISSAEEAILYLKKIHKIITYLGISDGDMSQGSMRCDINISLRPEGTSTLGTRAEIKNVNSFKFTQRAIAYEIMRQTEILEAGGKIVQETRLYNEEKQCTLSMRAKEDAYDYRYFPDPDLLPIAIDETYIQALKEQMPELPDDKLARFQSSYQLSLYDATLLTDELATAHYFEQTLAQCDEPKLIANWMNSDMQAKLNQSELTFSQAPLTPKHLATLIQRITDKTISGKIAKQIFEALWDNPMDVDQFIEKSNLKQESNTDVIQDYVQQVIDNNDTQVQQYRNAEADKRKKMLGFFVGQVMKLSKGSANPQQVNALLTQLLDNK